MGLSPSPRRSRASSDREDNDTDAHSRFGRSRSNTSQASALSSPYDSTFLSVLPNRVMGTSPSPSPAKSKWDRIIRRASTGRPAIPEAKDPASTSSAQENTDTGSFKKFGRPRSSTAPSSRPSQSSAPHIRPIPSVGLLAPAFALSAAATTDPRSATSPVPPPLIDTSVSDLGGFTDDLDKLPVPNLIPDPYVLAAQQPEQPQEPEAQSQPEQPQPRLQPDGAAPGGQVSPPLLIDSMAVGPSGFTDDLVVPQSKSVSDPFVQNNTDHNKYLGHHQKGYSGDVDSDPDERQPLIHKSQEATTTSYSVNPPAGPTVCYNTFQYYQGITPPRLRERGWIEIHLLYSPVYYHNPTERVVTNMELRKERLLESVTAHLNLEQHKDSLERAPEGAELWLRDAGSAKRGFVPVRWWVVHSEKSVVFDKAFDVAVKRKLNKHEEDKLDMEYRYWIFIEAHPSHITLQPSARQEALEAIDWVMTDPLIPDQSPLPAPFTHEECKAFQDLLRSLDSKPNTGNLQVDTAIQTRTVARIFIRIAQWRQQHFRPKKPLPMDATANTPYPTYRQAFPCVLLDVTISCLCLGIPYLFVDRLEDFRTDEESGLRSMTFVYIIGVRTCLIAAIVLSSSVILLSFSGLDSVTRIASLVAIIFAVFSMMSTLFAIFTRKSDMERPRPVIGGEGFLMTSRRIIVVSLPIVFLLYSTIAFVTGVVLYSLKGRSIKDP